MQWEEVYRPPFERKLLQLSLIVLLLRVCPHAYKSIQIDTLLDDSLSVAFIALGGDILPLLPEESIDVWICEK